MREGVPAIAVRGLRKGFGDAPVLWDLDLTVERGEFLVIFGANGSGKTTLLKVLSTLARPDAGQVYIGGIDAKVQATSLRRGLGVVAHRNLLYEDLTCCENLRFFGRMFALRNLRDRIEEVLEQVGLTGRAHHLVRTLSHGMQKRLAIARAILHRPNLLLLDEPEAGLDQGALEMLARLLEEWKAAKGSVVMTTHDLERGLEWGDRVAILADGRIAFEDERHVLDVAGFRGTYQRYLEEER